MTKTGNERDETRRLIGLADAARKAASEADSTSYGAFKAAIRAGINTPDDDSELAEAALGAFMAADAVWSAARSVAKAAEAAFRAANELELSKKWREHEASLVWRRAFSIGFASGIVLFLLLFFPLLAIFNRPWPPPAPKTTKAAEAAGKDIINMKCVIVEPSFEVYEPHPADDLYMRVERAGRMSHGSEGPPEARPDYIRRLIAMGHESVLEHVSINAVIKTDRGIMAELTRHRIAAFTVASTRFINYGPGGKPFEVVAPPFPPTINPDGFEALMDWESLMEAAEDTYRKVLGLGFKPELARSVLPMSFATDIFMTCNVRQWRHVMRQRIAKAAHPQMRSLMRDGLAKLTALYPALFGDVRVES